MDRYEEAARVVLSQMTLEEKVFLMSGHTSRTSMHGALKGTTGAHYNENPYLAGGCARLKVPPIAFGDGSKGVVCGTGKSTAFPVSLMRGATFHPQLERKIGHAIGREIRAYGGTLFGGVCLNLLYHPGWGRSQESYGEDTVHVGIMGRALMEGVQAEGVMAAVKHFAFNQMEALRFDADVHMDRRTEREQFLHHFQRLVEAGCAAVMTSYNRYNGEYCGQNAYLLTDVLRKEWGFRGFVMSDFTWGIRDTVTAASSGQDMEMADTRLFGLALLDAVRRNEVPESAIDEAAISILQTQLRFADYPVQAVTGSVIGCAEHRTLALQAAREGAVLLKNQNAVLPVSVRRIHEIAVFGVLADEDNLGDHGSSRVYPPYVVTILNGLRKLTPDSVRIRWYAGQNLAHMQRLAKQADVALVIAGLTAEDEGEGLSRNAQDAVHGDYGGDRASLTLSAGQEAGITAIGESNRQTVVITIGSMVQPGAWLTKTAAFMHAFYPGMEGGTAIAELILGKLSPSGKLPYAIARQETDYAPVDYRTPSVTYSYWHGYQRLDHFHREPLFPFGYGLSYTAFSLSDCQLTEQEQTILVTCRLRNTGAMRGAEVVQVYAGRDESDYPVKKLLGFSKCWLDPGEETIARIVCRLDDLAVYEGRRFHIRPGIYHIYVGTSEADPNSWRTDLLL